MLLLRAALSIPVLMQPLYAPHVRVAKGVYKNIIIIATEFNSVYGFDAGAH